MRKERLVILTLTCYSDGNRGRRKQCLCKCIADQEQKGIVKNKTWLRTTRTGRCRESWSPTFWKGIAPKTRKLWELYKNQPVQSNGLCTEQKSSLERREQLNIYKFEIQRNRSNQVRRANHAIINKRKVLPLPVEPSSFETEGSIKLQ